jgi:hypothetical protein
MAKVKFDFARVKKYFLEKGERVGLYTAAGVTGLFLLLGLIMALRAHSRDTDLLKSAKALDGKIRSDNSFGPPDPSKITAPEWVAVDPLEFLCRPWEYLLDPVDTRLRNPPVLPVGRVVGDKVADLLVSEIRRPVFVYKASPEAKTVDIFSKGGPSAPDSQFTNLGGLGAGGREVVRDVKAERMLVVHSVFPWREQVKLFQVALRKDTVSELFKSPETTPQVLGLSVMRREYPPPPDKKDKKPDEWWEPYYIVQPNGRIEVRGVETRALLKVGVFDHDETEQVKELLLRGLDTPLPALAYLGYPGLNFQGISTSGEMVATKGGPKGRPGDKGLPPNLSGKDPFKKPGGSDKIVLPGGDKGGKKPAGDPVADAGIETRPLGKLTGQVKLAFARRFSAKRFYPFEPFDEPLASLGVKGQSTGAETDDGKQKATDDPDDILDAQEKSATAKGLNGKVPDIRVPEHVLVRFFDADVRPGKSYQYLIRVVMKNPNFGKTKEVMVKSWAEVETLESLPVVTPWRVVEPEWQFYVVDQKALRDSKYKLAMGSDRSDLDAEQAPVQIQQWQEDFTDPSSESQQLGDWLVLERLRVRRGDWIQKDQVPTALPAWNADKGRFEPGGNIGKRHGRKFVKSKSDYVAIDFRPKASAAPMVLDFTGGKKSYRVGTNVIPDNGALEMLVLSPDGKLLTRSSREDTDRSDPHGAARVRHHQEWRDRLERLLGVDRATGKK